MIDLKKLLLVLSLLVPFLSAQQNERPTRGQRPDRQQTLERLHAAQGRLQNLQQRLERIQQPSQSQGQSPQQGSRSGRRGPGAGMGSARAGVWSRTMTLLLQPLRGAGRAAPGNAR